MKIAILNNLFPPNSRGGAEEAAKLQAEKFLAEGKDVVVLTLSPKNRFSVRDDLAALAGSRGSRRAKIYELRHRNIFNYFNIGKKPAVLRFLWHIIDVFNFRLACDIKKILQKEKPDLVICHNMKGLSFLTPLKINNLKIKDWQVVHDVQLYTPSGLIEYGKEEGFEHTGLPSRIYRFFTRRFFGYAEKVFFPSQWLLNFYKDNGFFKNQKRIYEPNEAGFKFCTFDGKRDGFLYVGQLERHKGILLLLDAFEKLSPPVIPAKAGISTPAGKIPHKVRDDGPVLYIVGDGSLMPEVKKRAEKNPKIVICGRVAREKLPEFYARAQATIFPSLVYENAPMVIAESLSCGTPVIASCLGGAPELIHDGENGYFVMPGDIDDLAEKMKRLA